MINQAFEGKSRSVVLAAVHGSAPLFDRTGSVAKACALIAEAAKSGARLVVFPESFLPGFPIWTGLYRPIDAHRFFRKFAENSFRPDQPEFQQIQAAAARHRIFVNLGFSEVSATSPARMWNSQALIGDDGSLLNLHRKLVPTFYEQLTWDRGDAAGLRIVETAIGRIGGLVCGENNNPLSRYVLMSEGEEIHCASYPAVWPFRNPLKSEPYNLREAIQFRAAAHSFEAKAFTIVSAGLLDQQTIEIVSETDAEVADILRACPKACSMIIGPMGTLLSKVLQDEEGLAIAEVDLSSLIELKQHHDMAGYYNRMDLFHLRLLRERPEALEVAEFVDAACGRPDYSQAPAADAAGEAVLKRAPAGIFSSIAPDTLV